MAAKFTASQFTPTEWSTAEDKAKFVNHFVRFVKSDFKRTLFPHWFYTRLSMTFGHIAHYNIHGFYAEFFTKTEDKLDFLKKTVNPWHGFAGDPHYTYCDVEKELAKWVVESGLLEEYGRRHESEVETYERKELARLQEKYGT